jgi:hypothetical protein
MTFYKILKEIIDQAIQQNKYEDWEKGVVKAWGHVLYLGYHDVPTKISKIVDEETTKEIFKDYYKNSDDDYDLQDWMSNNPPTMDNGFAVFDKDRLSRILSSIANKTKITEPLIIYRYEDTSYDTGWNSYTTNKDAGYPGEKKSYTIPIGYPVIFADGIADNNEVIINLGSKEKSDFLNK